MVGAPSAELTISPTIGSTALVNAVLVPDDPGEGGPKGSAEDSSSRGHQHDDEYLHACHGQGSYRGAGSDVGKADAETRIGFGAVITGAKPGARKLRIGITERK